MNKTELLLLYTSEQLADMLVTAIRSKEDDEKLIRIITSTGKDLAEQIDEKQNEIDRLQSEVEKYRKAFEDTKNERDCQIAEYQKKIEELENRDIVELLPTDPIKVSDMLINVMHKPCASVLSFGKPYSMYDVSELRQIAEHLLVYCNVNKGVKYE